MGDLPKLRKKIDEIDDKLLLFLNKRAKIVLEIGKIKQKENLELHSPIREHEIFHRLEQENKGPFSNEIIRTIFREIMSGSLSLEGQLKVAYLGPKATFSHLACLQKYGNSAHLIPVSQIKDVFQEVEQGSVEYGVVPIENSTDGTVTRTLDSFVDSNLRITGEIYLEVHNYLISESSVIENLKKVYSHPQPIMQCQRWIEKHLSHVQIVEVESTAKAAELCLNNPAAAAIASELAAKLYGLNILAKRIEDNVHNTTRFLMVSRKPIHRTGRDKTSILFSIKDRIGALSQILQPFADAKINLTKIESRPSKKKPWEYFFFLDLEGHEEDSRVQKALEKLKDYCLFFKVLGSYPVGN
ncbi:MAG: prephenate dehydratase [Nitrospiria bacterium]